MRLVVSRTKIPLLATIFLFLLIYLIASLRYEGFFTLRVFLNLLKGNSFLGLASIGMTFVILSGGIDLSVGARIGFTSILIASLTEKSGFHPIFAIGIALVIGTILGAGMGGIVRAYRLPPFLVTLAGMFLIRGLASVISLEAIAIKHPFFGKLDDWSYDFFPVTILIFLFALLIGVYVAHWTRFGRNVYAVGGSESSALLMGLPVGSVKVWVYALSGFCSTSAGVVYTFYTSSGNASAGTGLELDAIAAVVIGGTLLSGGVGYLWGTFVGVLILGVIQTVITFEGTLSSWWTKIVIGLLLLAFILLQRVIQGGTRPSLS